MDKYEYKLKTEEMLELMEDGEYRKAAAAADLIDCTTLNRLETITDIRKCSGDNNTHCIINIRFLHKIRIFCPYDL